MVQNIESAIAAAYAGIADTNEVLILINHFPLENVGWQQSLQSDKPEIIAAIAQKKMANHRSTRGGSPSTRRPGIGGAAPMRFLLSGVRDSRWRKPMR